MLAYIVLVLVGESSYTLLCALYFKGGGNNIFLVAILETIGFPILIPISIYFSTKSIQELSNKTIMATVYTFFGLLEAGCGVLDAIGIQHLPVSTYSLISTTQLAFNAVFAFFLNSEKLSLSTLNAVFLLTISSSLLIFQPNNDQAGKARAGNFVVGFSSTLAGSIIYALTLSLTQLIFNKIIKKETFSSLLNMIIFKSLIATLALLAPLLASGGWQVTTREMETFQHGRAAYMAILVAIAVSSQLQAIGSLGLILEVSSLFSNVIATVGLPIVPILGAIFFHESLDGIKVISIISAVWGFASYVCDHYFHDREIVSKQIQESSLTNIPLSSCL